MKRHGFTLLELVVCVFLLLLAGLSVTNLFTLGRRAQQSTIASYVVSGQADTAIKYLTRDLQETALVSIQSYSSPPGCSFVSARNPSNQNSAQVNVSPYGAPLWTKNVLYTLDSSGDLIRWEQPLSAAEKDYIPRPTTTLPSAVPGSEPTRRVVLHQLLAPNARVNNLGGSPNYQADAFGGFRVEFVRRQGGEGGTELLSAVNPGNTTASPDPADNSSLVDVTLQVLSSDAYYPSLYSVEFQVHPRY